MSFVEVMSKVEALSEADQAKLSAYLTFLKKKRDPAFAIELKRRFAERDPTHWVVAEVPEKYRVR